jgi:hypothetical protein
MTDEKPRPTDRPERGPVTIVYKSGAKVVVTCKNFTVRKRGGEIVEVQWEKPDPRPLHIGVDEIAAVWDGDVT